MNTTNVILAAEITFQKDVFIYVGESSRKWVKEWQLWISRSIYSIWVYNFIILSVKVDNDFDIHIQQNQILNSNSIPVSSIQINNTYIIPANVLAAGKKKQANHPASTGTILILNLPWSRKGLIRLWYNYVVHLPPIYRANHWIIYLYQRTGHICMFSSLLERCCRSIDMRLYQE